MAKFTDTLQNLEDFINLELSVKRFKGNLTKFFYNPIPITKQTKHLFPYLRTLYLYSSYDELFLDDNNIIARVECLVDKYNLLNDQIYQIEEWTNKSMKDVLFDSNIDDWNEITSTLSSILLKKQHLLFLIEDEEKKKFGGYLSSQIDKVNVWITDSNAFLFTFSNNSKEKYSINNEFHAFFLYPSTSTMYLFGFGRGRGHDLCICNQQNKHLSFCCQNNSNFNLRTVFGCIFATKKFVE